MSARGQQLADERNWSIHGRMDVDTPMLNHELDDPESDFITATGYCAIAIIVVIATVVYFAF